MGFNALESYGPVHSWGKWTGMELYKVTKAATRFARSRVWNCAWEGQKDHYGRMLVFCRDLVEAMVSEGYGHVYALKPPVDEALLAMQREIKSEMGSAAARAVAAPGRDRVGAALLTDIGRRRVSTDRHRRWLYRAQSGAREWTGATAPRFCPPARWPGA